MKTRYVTHTTLLSVEERFENYNYRKVGDQTLYDTRSIGWFARIDDSSAISLGDEKPDWRPGDKIKITLEKVS